MKAHLFPFRNTTCVQSRVKCLTDKKKKKQLIESDSCQKQTSKVGLMAQKLWKSFQQSAVNSTFSCTCGKKIRNVLLSTNREWQDTCSWLCIHVQHEDQDVRVRGKSPVTRKQFNRSVYLNSGPVSLGFRNIFFRLVFTWT